MGRISTEKNAPVQNLCTWRQCLCKGHPPITFQEVLEGQAFQDFLRKPGRGEGGTPPPFPAFREGREGQEGQEGQRVLAFSRVPISTLRPEKSPKFFRHQKDRSPIFSKTHFFRGYLPGGRVKKWSRK